MDERTGLPVVGMVGAGQLARMTHQAAIALGQSLRILADSLDDGAALVASDVVVGDYRSLADLRAFAAGCDVVTFDHEHVPNEHIAALAADGVTVAPGAGALRFAQDKAAMRTRLAEMGVPGPRWVDLSTSADPRAALTAFGAEVGWPLVLKASRGGYDGKGVWVRTRSRTQPRSSASGTPLLAEEKVPIARELAAVVARSPFGQGAAWCVVETVQRDGICVEVIAPAPGLDPRGRAVAASRSRCGSPPSSAWSACSRSSCSRPTDGRLLVNELAMRPHNSGHWTIEGARTSQFEQHLRAVLDYPLGATTPTAPVVVMANVLGGPDDTRPKRSTSACTTCMARWPDVKIHLYGKGLRPGRKIGHVTALGDDLADVRDRAQAAADYLVNGDADG